MSGHGDHSADEQERKVKLDDAQIAFNYVDALNPQANAIPSIKLLRSLYGLGLKEAKDIHDGVMQITGRRAYSDEDNLYRTYRVVAANDYALGTANVRDALDRAESAERFAETLRADRDSLVRQVRSLEIDLEVKSLQEEIATRQRAIAELDREQAEVRNGGQPWSNLPLDEEPF